MGDETTTTAQGDTEAAEKAKADAEKTEAAKVEEAKKADDAKAAEAKAAADKAAEEGKPPETYDIKLSENSPLTQADLERTVADAKKLRLSNKGAQELLDERADEIGKFLEQTQKDADAWEQESKDDKEIGGDNMKETEQLSKRALDAYADEDLKKMLGDTGLGNHKSVLRFLRKVGATIADDKIVAAGGAAGKKEVSHAEALYPKDVPKPKET